MEKSITPDWIRLQKVIKAEGMTVHGFAMFIGLKRSENLYQIKKGNHGISKQLATTINAILPKYSISWLMTGENPLCKNLPQYGEEIKTIPVYRTMPFTGIIGSENDFKSGNNPGPHREVFSPMASACPTHSNIPVDHYVYLGESLANGAEFGIINTDESLGPRIPVGALILLRPHTGPIVFGKLFLIVTEDFAIVRKIRSTENLDEYRLIPLDTENYDEVTFNKHSAIEIYHIVAINFRS